MSLGNDFPHTHLHIFLKTFHTMKSVLNSEKHKSGDQHTVCKRSTSSELLGDCLKENRRKRGKASLDSRLSNHGDTFRVHSICSVSPEWHKNILFILDSYTQAVTFVFLFLGWSMLKVIRYYPKLGDIKFHSIPHKTEQYLGQSAEKSIFISLCFCLSVLDHLDHKSKKSLTFPSTSPLFYLPVLVTITLLSNCLCSCFIPPQY